MLAPYRIPGSVELIPQHSGTHERVLQMQFVDTPHQFQITGTHRMGLIVDGTAADANQLSLALNRKGMATVDYRFALSNPALVSALSKKSFSSVN